MPLSSHERARHADRQRVREAAAGRHGIFRRADLRELGIDISTIRTFTRRGWWTRLHHGIYIDSEVLALASDPLARARILTSAAIASLPGEAFAFGATAARLHGLAFDRALGENISLVRGVATDQRAFHRRVTAPSDLVNVSVHRHALRVEDLTEIEGIPTVDRKTAAVTTAALSSPMWALVTLDSLAWKRPDTLALLPGWVEEWSGIRGIGTVRAAVPRVRSGAQTPLETISRYQLTRMGIGEPQLQVPFEDEDGLIGVVDMAWPDLRVIGEADGLSKYVSRDDLIAEKVREDRLRALGWLVVRWTWSEILGTPRMVADRVRRAASVAMIRSA